MPEAFCEPLTGRDAWFLYAERPETPLDLGTVYVFDAESEAADGGGALDIEKRVAERLHLVPRYRQRVQRVSLGLGHPVWVDDANFDLGYHIRHEALRPPADGRTLRATVMRILARPLDMRRPLWEMTVIQGLKGGRVVIVNRAHHAMVDGASNFDIVSLLLDTSPEGRRVDAPAEPWRARPTPSPAKLVWRLLWNPFPQGGQRATLAERARGWWLPWSGVLSLGRSVARPRADLFFNRRIGPQRTGRGVKLPLSEFKALKDRHSCTVNDAVLAVVAEGLHRWLSARGDWVPEKIRVFCPVSVRTEGDRSPGNRISGMVLELPTGALPIEERLRRIKYTTGDLKRTRQAIAADKLVGLADWAPATLLVLAGRVMSNQQGGANLNVTNVPGPQLPLYSGGARLLEIWPFAPLYPSMGLGVAIVSYNGEVFFGFTADPGLVPDVEEFTRHVREAAEHCLTLVR